MRRHRCGRRRRRAQARPARNDRRRARRSERRGSKPGGWRGPTDGGWRQREQAERVGCRGQRSFAFPGDDGVGHRHDLARGCITHRAVDAAVAEQPLQVERHAPHRIVAVPRAFDAGRRFAALAGALEERRRSEQSRLRAAAGEAVRRVIGVFGERLQNRAAGIRVAAAPGAALAVVRQVGLVAVDADQVLERAGDARLLVRLQLRR